MLKQGLAFLIAFAGATVAPADPGAMIHARSVDAFSATLVSMGYKPAPAETVHGIPVIRLDIGDQPTALALGGCSNARDCSYVVLTTSYTDVDPQADWLARMNDNFDLVKLTRNDQGALSIRSGVALGSDGIPITTFRMILDQWQAALSEVAQAAIDERLVRP